MGSESTLKNRLYPLIRKDFSREESGAVFKSKNKQNQSWLVYSRLVLYNNQEISYFSP